MTDKYYIMYNPLTFNLMDILGNCSTSLDLLSYLSGLDTSKLSAGNYLDFLSLDLSKQRKGMVETLGVESYAAQYIANQIVKIDTDARVILADGKRRNLQDIIKENGKPDAVFITSMSSNFPTVIANVIPLNFAKIPVIIGGIHASTSPDDVDTFIKSNVPYPELVSQVKGGGDSEVISEILFDLEEKVLKSEYIGNKTIEDGVWGQDNIDNLPPMKLKLLKKVPIIGRFIANSFRMNPITPYLGCPYSCNFCSISTIPKNQRQFVSRSPEDFVSELKNFQKNGTNFNNRFFFFLPDNLLLGGKKLEEILDKIIDSDLKINYASQISIEVANNENLLEKLRLSGATHFFIGFESLDIKNLEYIGKNMVKDVKKSGLTLSEYYTKQIKKIQDKGISVHGAFIFGLPYDYYNSSNNHTGIDIGNFCIENHIGLQPCSLTDLPGSKNYLESVKKGTFLYGQPGTMDHLLSYCVSDLTEMNRTPPKLLFESPLLVFYMAYQAIQKVGLINNTLSSALFTMKKSFLNLTKKGNVSFKEKLIDAFYAFVAPLVVSQYKEHGEAIAYSRNGIKGSFERLYNLEKNDCIKELLGDYVKKFM